MSPRKMEELIQKLKTHKLFALLAFYFPAIFIFGDIFLIEQIKHFLVTFKNSNLNWIHLIFKKGDYGFIVLNFCGLSAWISLFQTYRISPGIVASNWPYQEEYIVNNFIYLLIYQ